MNEKHLSHLDKLSVTVLLLWVGMAFAIGALAAPVVSRQLPSGDVAGRILAACYRRIDLMSWFAFGLPFLSSYGSRWMAEIDDAGLSPTRLWSAAALVALLMCFTSSAIVNPRMEAVREEAQGSVESLPEGSPERKVFTRAQSISKQLLGLRILLALGLAVGVSRLPKGPKTAPGN